MLREPFGLVKVRIVTLNRKIAGQIDLCFPKQSEMAEIVKKGKCLGWTYSVNVFKDRRVRPVERIYLFECEGQYQWVIGSAAFEEVLREKGVTCPRIYLE